MSTRVVEVFTLQVELAAVFLTHALGKVEWGGSADIILQQGVIFFLEFLAFYYGFVGILQVFYGLVEYLWYVSSAVDAIEAVIVNSIFTHFLLLSFRVCVCVNYLLRASYSLSIALSASPSASLSSCTNLEPMIAPAAFC